MPQNRLKALTRPLLPLAIAWLSGCIPIRDASTDTSAFRHLSDADDARVKVVVRSPTVTISGSGVWLGNGQVLTAAHLFVGRKDGDPVEVMIRQHRLAGTLLSHGDLGDYDLAIVDVPSDKIPKEVEEIPHPMVCRNDETIGAKLYVVAYDQSHQTTASPEHAFEEKGKLWSTTTTATFSHGVSGAGVFDAKIGCIAGIVSRFESGWHITQDADEYRKCMQAIVANAYGPSDLTCAFDSPTLFTPATRITAFLDQSADRAARTSKSSPR